MIKNHDLYLLGRNENGTIPNFDDDTDSVALTTHEKWLKFKLKGFGYSVSSHGVLCSSNGDVAAWGKMYYFNSE